MCVQFTPHELDDVSRRQARLRSEQALLNPGKAVPTLHRCAEYGRMHVQPGQVQFPELPRF